MGRRNISRKAWQRAVNALLWYQDNKAEAAELREELTTRDPEHEGGGSRAIRHDPTAETATRLVDNLRLQNLEAEIKAVEESMKDLKLKPEQVEVIRQRFWEPCRVGGRRKPRQYDYMCYDLGYSPEAMKKIVRKIIEAVAAKLGER